MRRRKHDTILTYWLCLLSVSLGATPNVKVTIGSTEYLAKRALFGSKDDFSGELIKAPDSDPLLCNYDKIKTPTSNPNSIMVIPRGECTFEKKAFVARKLFGVAGVLIYDNLSAKYGFDEKTDRVTWPSKQWDYECENGFGTVMNLPVPFDPPKYNADALDPFLTGCPNMTRTWNPCESNTCVITGHKENSTEYPICCVWDLPSTMGWDENIDHSETADVLAVFLTMSQWKEIKPLTNANGTVATIIARERAYFNVSSLLVMIMGIFATLYGSYYAAKEYREFDLQLDEVKEKQGISPDGKAVADINEDNLYSDDDEEKTPEFSFQDERSGSGKGGLLGGWKNNLGKLRGKDDNNEPSHRRSLPTDYIKKKKGEKEEIKLKPGLQEDGSFVLHSLPPKKKKKKDNNKKAANNPEANALEATASQFTNQDITNDDDYIPEGLKSASMHTELTSKHIFGFVASASIMLTLLFHFRFYSFLFVIYALGSSGVVAFMIVTPILVRTVPKLGDDAVQELNKEVCCRQNGFDITSQLVGLGWAGIWIYVGYTTYQPLTHWYFWITQDIFGICMCIMFLGAMKIYSIKIATYLLVAVFFYDIFFVFVTPLFTSTGQSVMLAVAGVGEDIIDDYCTKYPEESDCTGVTSLPIVLSVPRVNDWGSGSSVLGLGDILLPGWLVAYGARVDYATRLLGKHTNIKNINVPEKWYQGYFFALSVGYVIGLLLSFIVVWSTGEGQPALLYLSPTCLAAIFIAGRKEIKEHWTDSRILRLADKLKRKCQKKWSRQRMQRLIQKKKRQRARHQGSHGSAPGQQRMKRSSSAERQRSGGRLTSSGRGRDTSSSAESQRGGGRVTSRGRGGGRGRGRNGQGRGRSRSPARQGSHGNFSPGNRKAAAGRSQDHLVEPAKADVCFGDEDHPGTQDFLRAVENSLDTFAEEDFSPEVFKYIKRRLKAKKFLFNYGSGWKVASKLITKNEFEKAFKKAKADVI